MPTPSRDGAEIPTRADWELDDPDEVSDEGFAYRNFHGKSLAEAVTLFAADNGLGRFEDLYYMPGRVFEFYIQAASAYLASGAALGDSDSASCYVNPAAFFAEHYPDRLRTAWEGMEPILQHLADHQDDLFEATWAIYGNFRLKVHAAVERGFQVSFPTDVCELVPCAMTAERMAWWCFRPVSWPTARQVWRCSGVTGLTPDATRDDILRVFGQPTATGGGIDHAFGPIPDWIRYDSPAFEVRYSFAPDGRVADVFFLKADRRFDQMPPIALLPD